MKFYIHRKKWTNQTKKMHLNVVRYLAPTPYCINSKSFIQIFLQRLDTPVFLTDYFYCSLFGKNIPLLGWSKKKIKGCLRKYSINKYPLWRTGIEERCFI